MGPKKIGKKKKTYSLNKGESEKGVNFHISLLLTADCDRGLRFLLPQLSDRVDALLLTSGRESFLPKDAFVRSFVTAVIFLKKRI